MFVTESSDAVNAGMAIQKEGPQLDLWLIGWFVGWLEHLEGLFEFPSQKKKTLIFRTCICEIICLNFGRNIE